MAVVDVVHALLEGDARQAVAVGKGLAFDIPDILAAYRQGHSVFALLAAGAGNDGSIISQGEEHQVFHFAICVLVTDGQCGQFGTVGNEALTEILRVLA